LPATAKPKTKTAALTTTQKLDEIFKDVNRSDAPGLVVGVSQRGETLYRRAFGLASVELGVANTPWTRIRIGSTSKHFTSLAALLLAEEGKLDIDAGVRTYLPELPDLRPEATLRQLMSHTSGYRCYLDVSFLSDGMAIKPKGSALAAQVRQTAVNFPPGERMIYCNGGYHLLSLIIERVSGVAFEQFLKDRIFDPLGMLDTSSVPSDFSVERGVASLYLPLPQGGYRRGIFPTEEVRGEGAMISTIDDMLLWLKHMRGPKKVGSDASWAQMLTMTTLNNGLVNPYGLGLMRHDYRGVEVIHHGGGVVGGATQMITVPSHELDIIIITNGALMAPGDAAHKVIDAVLGDKVLAAAKKLPASKRFKPMVGTRYHAKASGLQFGFVEADGKLAISVFNSQGLPLLRLDFEDVAIGPLVVDAAAMATSGEAPAKLVISEGGNAETFVKLPAKAPSLKAAGQPLVGRYRAPDLDAEAEVTLSGDKLELKVHGKMGLNLMELEPFSNDVFGWKVPDAMLPLRGSLSVERKGGTVKGFRIDTSRSRHVWFERLADRQGSAT
jgi:CubicO group peptidase (beta-lactamase class C family)